MMPYALSILSGAVLTIFLWRVLRSSRSHGSELLSNSQVDYAEFPCPAESVDRMFCSEDWEFVSQFKSPQLNALFLAERRSIAAAWVKATSGTVRRIMRDHVLLSRSSGDLEIGTEVKIYLYYVALQAACVFLLAALSLVGPVRLSYLSAYVYSQAERLINAHDVLKTSTRAKTLQGASRP